MPASPVRVPGLQLPKWGPSLRDSPEQAWPPKVGALAASESAHPGWLQLDGWPWPWRSRCPPHPLTPPHLPCIPSTAGLFVFQGVWDQQNPPVKPEWETYKMEKRLAESTDYLRCAALACRVLAAGTACGLNQQLRRFARALRSRLPAARPCPPTCQLQD